MLNGKDITRYCSRSGSPIPVPVGLCSVRLAVSQVTRLCSGRVVGQAAASGLHALNLKTCAQVMWLVAEAEEALRNSTLLDLQLALDLARLQSVAYCHFPNVAAWNCSRCGRAEGPAQTGWCAAWVVHMEKGLWSQSLRAPRREDGTCSGARDPCDINAQLSSTGCSL